MSNQVLIIDHHNRERTLYAASLVGYGCEVLEARTFEEAASILQTGIAPRTILIDGRHSAPEIGAFISLVRYQLRNQSSRIVLMNDYRSTLEAPYRVYADLSIRQTTELTDLVHAL
jgi:DNA-binding NtrC family response regulator